MIRPNQIEERGSWTANECKRNHRSLSIVNHGKRGDARGARSIKVVITNDARLLVDSFGGNACPAATRDIPLGMRPVLKPPPIRRKALVVADRRFLGLSW